MDQDKTLSNPRAVSLEEAAARLFNQPLMIRMMDGRVLAANLRQLRNDGTAFVQFIEQPKINAMYGSGDSTVQRKPYKIAGDGVAVIEVSGRLVNRYGWAEGCGYTSYEYLRSQLNFALGDNDVKSICLRVESGGGECAGSFELADLIFRARSQKKIYGVTDDYAYSAGFLLLSQCEKVFVTRTGGTGSVGVIAQLLDVTEFDKKVGFNYVVIHAGSKKAAGNPHMPIDEDTVKDLQGEIDRLYGMFITAVARGRGMTEAAVRKTEAGLFMGQDAIAIGFADEIANFHEVIARLTNEKSMSGGMPPAQMVAEETSPAMEADSEPSAPVLEEPSTAAPPVDEPVDNPADEAEDKEEETMPEESIQTPAPTAKAGESPKADNGFKEKLDMCALAGLAPLATYGEMSAGDVQKDLFNRLAARDNQGSSQTAGSPLPASAASKMDEIEAAAKKESKGSYAEYRRLLTEQGQEAYAAYSAATTQRIS